MFEFFVVMDCILNQFCFVLCFEYVFYEMIVNLYLNIIWKEVSFVYNILMIKGILCFKKKVS